MAPKRHDVSPEQGMLLAPTPAASAFGKVLEHEGVYYNASATFLADPEKERLERLVSERAALEGLTRESSLLGQITNLDNRLRDVDGEYFKRPENEDKYVERMQSDREKALESLMGVRLGIKGSFARSIGIEVYTAKETKLGEDGNPLKDKNGDPLKKAIIKTVDADKQQELDEKYRVFRMTYEHKVHKKRRDRRIAEVKVQEKELVK